MISKQDIENIFTFYSKKNPGIIIFDSCRNKIDEGMKISVQNEEIKISVGKRSYQCETKKDTEGGIDYEKCKPTDHLEKDKDMIFLTPARESTQLESTEENPFVKGLIKHLSTIGLSAVEVINETIAEKEVKKLNGDIKPEVKGGDFFHKFYFRKSILDTCGGWLC